MTTSRKSLKRDVRLQKQTLCWRIIYEVEYSLPNTFKKFSYDLCIDSQQTESEVYCTNSRKSTIYVNIYSDERI